MKVGELLGQVNAKIGGADVATRVVDALVEKEVAERAAAMLVVIAKLAEVQRAGSRIKPDVETFVMGENGVFTDAAKVYSKTKADEVRKNAEEQKRLEAAIDAALEGNFDKVKGLAKGGKPAETSE